MESPGTVTPAAASGLTAGGPAVSLVPGVLRLAAALPSTGPRGGDLGPVAEWLGEQTGARQVRIRMPAVVDGPPPEYVWTAPRYRDDGAAGRPEDAGAATIYPIPYRGGEIGALVVVPPPPPARPDPTGGAGSAGPRDPLADVAAVLGVVVAGAAARTQARLARRRGQDTAARIADARQRAASRMESERYALERDLHDGVQLHLVSLQVAAAVAEHRLTSPAADEHTLTDALDDLGSRLNRTHQLLVDTAAGVAPGPLRADGLAAALTESFREVRDVTLLIAPGARSRRYPPIVESTVYFTCLEAVNNALKHAPGASVTVTVRDTYHGLWFEVADTGPGLDPAAGPGLAALRARLAAIDATPAVASAPGAGTRVSATIPI
jgi:signal transduction histidine kinase